MLYIILMHISYLADLFLADLLLVYIYFNYGNNIREKANSSDFPIRVHRDNSQQHIWPRNCLQMYSTVVVQEVLQSR